MQSQLPGKRLQDMTVLLLSAILLMRLQLHKLYLIQQHYYKQGLALIADPLFMSEQAQVLQKTVKPQGLLIIM